MIETKLLMTAHTVTAGFKIANEMCPKIWITIITVRPKLSGGRREKGSPSQCTVPAHPKNNSDAVPIISARTMQTLSNVFCAMTREMNFEVSSKLLHVFGNDSES